ncbi:AraC family transcriptional regulator [Bradyrhizobium pachyrhizi]|uniref:AraC family transcriptional regulator n=1 Tax=Bradyrhizobium pachyrhizi TaxID=280333 RepID=UPI003D35CEFD
MSLELSLRKFDAKKLKSPAIAMRVEVSDHKGEGPLHRHSQGQLVLALKGGVTCEVANSIWMVPPTCAVWVPGGMMHSIRATANARICFLFVKPGAAALPVECCTLSISPLIRELIQHLADLTQEFTIDSPAGRLVGVLLEQLVLMPIERLHLPMPQDRRIRKIAEMLSEDPADRSTFPTWASRVAMNERSLSRLMHRETGLSFGRWRRQLHLIVALRELSAGATVQEVSGALGYESVTAFITMFKKALGKPPGKYFADMQQSRW